ncbi:hypothetical protein SYNPS1DRAFT_30601 [Syncephalis pseudoplumigaleata]|uniref:Protein kinase domain-containing protein n=1 Tax=Syncephalis pseudoplumigaleata TaxID=1712513 RepID=A0A4P9YUW9_9FUNG|nr:hypothetical protein SYNPS1DRAFT_30601 [Syncephalis pseudoplumigaleata]|eukprot:RKP23644.1 hypothetical protein SYNPS1DRAFT_30601 [Syncephalis pseudoplumigaleata]
MIYGHTPFSHLGMLQKIQCIQDPHYEIAYPTSIAPIAPGQDAFTVDPEFIRVLKSCLIRDPKGRATIPQLLADPILHRQGASQAAKPVYPPLTPSLMSSIVKKVVEYGKRHPNRLNSPQGVDELSQASRTINTYCHCVLMIMLLLGLLRAFMQEYQRTLAANATSSSSTSSSASGHPPYH